MLSFIVAFILILVLVSIPIDTFAEDARLQLTADGLTITKDGSILGTVVDIEYFPGTGYVTISLKDLAGNDAIVITETAGLPVITGIGFYTTANFAIDFANESLANLATRNYGDLNGLPVLYTTGDFAIDFAAENLANLALRTHGSLTGIGVSDHHVKYLDADAITAMGVLGDANPLNHTRYADAEAISAMTNMGGGNIGNAGTLGVGIVTPDASSVVDFTSTTLGFLPPRMTTIERDAIAAPAEGLVIYNTTTDSIDFRNGTAWMQLVEANAHLAEMFMYEAGQPVTIDTANVYHGVIGFSTGSINDFTFDAGREVDPNISAEADNTDLQIDTSLAHGLLTGDIVTLSNMNNAGHNGACDVVFVDADTFDCDNIAYVAGAGASAGRVVEPSYLQAGTNAAGTYLFQLSISGQSVGTGITFKWELNNDITPIDTIVSERKHTNTDMGAMASSGFVTIVAGDRIWLSTMNKDNTTDFTIEHANVNGHRL